MKIMINGSLCDDKKAMVSVYDHGFLYGMGLFETLRTYQGQCYLLAEHIQRLERGCQHIGMVWEPNLQSIEVQIMNLLKVNHLEDAYIRISVSAGEAELGLPSVQYNDTNTIIYIKKLPVMENKLYISGKPLQRLQIKRSIPHGGSQLKSFQYMNNILAKKELQTYPWSNQAEGLFINEQGYLAEGIVSNVFFIRDQTVYTPALETGILAGITRSCVMMLCPRCDLNLEEGFYEWKDLLEANEVFITNSIQEVVPITKLFDHEGQSTIIGDGNVGAYTKQILQLYRTSTRRST